MANYFGKCTDVDNIFLEPINIEKDYKVAIFGLAHIKDRRLFKTFAKESVKYKKGNDFFNIIVVHRDRTPRE